MKRTEYAVESFDKMVRLIGDYDKNIDLIAENTNVKISVGDNVLLIDGEDDNVAKTVRLFDALTEYMNEGNDINELAIRVCLDLIERGKEYDIHNLNDIVAVTSKGKQIKCKSAGQMEYVKAMKSNSIVFGIGPAGTGKTYLAVALATVAFKAHEVEKIILTRPAVEAGEKLGFLPGDLGAKVDPYLRPLYDALQDMFGIENYVKLLEKGVIEIAPLAYMRGRTLSNSFIILDEAQNTTKEQMKMFLTRMGEGSKIVVTGDVTQIDLPSDKQSGLIHAVNVLKDVDGISMIKLTSKDVVRHELVQRIVNAYEAAERKEEEKKVRQKNRINNNDGKEYK